jgi:TolB protein
LVIEISKGIEDTALPIALVPFAGQVIGTAEADIAAIVRADLERSGKFRVTPFSDLPARPQNSAQIDFGVWRSAAVENLVIGQVQTTTSDGVDVSFQLFDSFKGAQIAGYRLPGRRGNLRPVAHRISDLIYKHLTGEVGVFGTQVAYVTTERSGDGSLRYLLQIADADGHNPQNILQSKQPILSPSWSRDGRRLAYVSFEGRKPAVYVQELSAGTRRKVAAFSGINGAPAFSPDGSRLALTLSKDGNPDIYLLDLGSSQLQRLTDHYGIDTEAAWAPDGNSLVFTSDRGGSPQLYRIAATGGNAERLTFSGDYNARAVFSPDGQQLALVHRVGNGFQIAVQDLASGQTQVLSPGPFDESPSFAPNGSAVIYASQSQGRAVLEAVSLDGKMRQRLGLSNQQVRDPAWSPLLP